MQERRLRPTGAVAPAHRRSRWIVLILDGRLARRGPATRSHLHRPVPLTGADHQHVAGEPHPHPLVDEPGRYRVAHPPMLIAESHITVWVSPHTAVSARRAPRGSRAVARPES